MKDRQIHVAGPQARIPVISSLLHWLAMPAIVFLRSGFGFSFLSPKSIFIAFSWAAILFTVYSRLEPGAWPKYWAVSTFGTCAAILYLVHLLTAFMRELNRKGAHDFYVGTSHLLRLAGSSTSRSSERLATAIHLWVEPAIVLFVAALLRGFTGEGRLSQGLAIVAFAMWGKEFVNHWYRLRQQKKQQDVFADAEEAIEENPTMTSVAAPKAAGRKARAKRVRARTEAEEGDERKFAEALRLLPPYSLAQAEQNYRVLIKDCHPDANDQSEDSNERAAALNEALEYFRIKLRALAE